MGCGSSAASGVDPAPLDIREFNLLIQYEEADQEEQIELLEKHILKKYPNADVNTYKRQEKMQLITIYC